MTPLSFDELWLKESTARLFEYIAVDAMEPSWHIWPNFVTGKGTGSSRSAAARITYMER